MENSVKNLASMFNQPAQSAVSPPPIGAKPSIGAKPGKLDLGNNIKIIGSTIRSPVTEKSSNGVAKSPSKPPPTAKPTVKVPTVKVPLGGPVLAGANSADILNIKSQLKKAPVPRPPPSSFAPSDAGVVDFRRSLKKAPVATPPKPKPTTILGQKSDAPSTDEADTDSKETLATEGESSSLSSFTSDSSITRRGSSSSQKTGVDDKKPTLEPLPPLETLGPPPRKPAKPENVKLPKSAVPPPVAGRKPSLLKTVKKLEQNDASDECGELYDDVAVTGGSHNKRISLIPTMDSDEESADDLLYDDTEIVPTPTLPPLPTVPSTQTTVPQTSGSDDGPQEIYDDVSLEGESEELYEALDVSIEDAKSQARPPSESIDSTDAKPPSVPSPKKISLIKSKQEEKQRREQEKLEQQRRKKDEEARKKREKEEKKRREKEEKEMKKKFNIKGDIRVLDTATAIQDCRSDYEKMDLVCKQGDRLEVLRREGNPQGKWLVRDPDGRYGFVDCDFLAVENDVQETYDDVIPCDESGSEEEEPQEIYEALN